MCLRKDPKPQLATALWPARGGHGPRRSGRSSRSIAKAKTVVLTMPRGISDFTIKLGEQSGNQPGRKEG